LVVLLALGAPRGSIVPDRGPEKSKKGPVEVYLMLCVKVGYRYYCNNESLVQSPGHLKTVMLTINRNIQQSCIH
jgi:hypothetical protein